MTILLAQDYIWLGMYYVKSFGFVAVTIILSNDFPLNSEQVQVYPALGAQPIYVTHIKHVFE